jgi:hypothetical protein
MKDRPAENILAWESIIKRVVQSRFSLDGVITVQFHVKHIRQGFLFSKFTRIVQA